MKPEKMHRSKVSGKNLILLDVPVNITSYPLYKTNKGLEP
jgi:hypothetical protein